ncbi:MAG: M20/M25/M40 family metallo-hydrolase, partial [Planctomycetota bacterium]|nr:M20/M25/M40 family metallo-hydrolase [Planctomycetota bacterium]
MLTRPRPAALVALMTALVLPAAARADTGAGLAAIREETARASVEHLASAALEGRGSGARGGHAAGDWLAEQLAALGLAPAGDEGYFQPFEAQGQRLRNVLAQVPGREPGEAVVIGAHYDHLGLGHQQGSLEFLRGRGRIHHGADDNASGTAAVLEVARAFVASGLQPRRRVVFAFFDGEERGLLGSTHYVEQAAGERVALMINLDMVGRLRRAVTVYGANTGDRLGDWLGEANRPLGLELDLRRTMTPNSDHWPFYQRRVPVLMPFTGLHTDYHRPSDVVGKLNVEGIAQIARLCFGVAALAAEAEEAAVFAEAPDGTGEAVLEQLQAMLGVERFGERLRELRERLG